MTTPYYLFFSASFVFFLVLSYCFTVISNWQLKLAETQYPTTDLDNVKSAESYINVVSMLLFAIILIFLLSLFLTSIFGDTSIERKEHYKAITSGSLKINGILVSVLMGLILIMMIICLVLVSVSFYKIPDYLIQNKKNNVGENILYPAKSWMTCSIFSVTLALLSAAALFVAYLRTLLTMRRKVLLSESGRFADEDDIDNDNDVDEENYSPPRGNRGREIETTPTYAGAYMMGGPKEGGGGEAGSSSPQYFSL